MSGSYSRNKGARFERECARRLAARTALDIVTTRSVGASYGADLCTVTAHDAHGRPVTHTPDVLGFSIEVKNETAWRPEQWLRQSIDQAAPGTRPIVIANRANAPFDRGWVLMPHPTLRWTATSIGNWLNALTEQAAA